MSGDFDPTRFATWSGVLAFCFLFWVLVGYGIAALLT